MRNNENKWDDFVAVVFLTITLMPVVLSAQTQYTVVDLGTLMKTEEAE